ncbi:uncharacterized protein EKO05_0006488 [Ascochyta rabiei]|uniref:Uncharacterized protein n=1 Tax=Didymella rabiei TaxID=5454 RepID=A0A162W4B0_DIDRA|nr:uncharacterized protein EKO05_0006488 [Ascochyta rabiei]KZM18786.1 hypothetical protein ST47_g10150 [Ascochyta rabiei]UPX16064.1 hypothetical protein EKO05_0006488 [Ascochyta rabiei]
MGWSFHGKKASMIDRFDAEKHLKRLHKTTPFIESPLTGADQENLVFSQRHEANSVELFFDLFFVANLATFTAYHSISDIDYLLAYIGFFGILWATWFQITLHDVRFARDSLYERICKTIQFITFVGLALAGSSFNPSGKANNKNFSILCYTLIISRGLLAIQYMVVLFYTWRAKYSKLYLPLGLMVVTYLVGTGAFAAMTPTYRPTVIAPRNLYMVWYAVMVAEAVIVITISCFWRMLSFKKTHLMERMSLLTIIVIGEGAIGVTKTVGRIMGKSGLDSEGCFLVMCIIVILVLLWALYFDNFPHGHYGTIRQQVWSLLHFPFQLAIVGVVEGAQQIAMARYVLKNAAKGTADLHKMCEQQLDGVKLRDALTKMVEYYQFKSKLDTYGYYDDIMYSVYNIGNATGICSPQNVTSYNSGLWPEEFNYIGNAISNGIYSGLGVKMPIDKLEKYIEPIQIAEKSWKLTYLYFWSCFCVLVISLIVFLFLIRRHKVDVFDYVSVLVRCLVLGAGAASLAVLANKQRLFDLLNSPAILPMAVVLLFIVLCCDKLASLWCNWRLFKSGEPYALEFEEEHHHGGSHGESHGQVHMTDDVERGNVHHGRPELKGHRKSAGWSIHADTLELSKENTEYSSRHLGDSAHGIEEGVQTPPLQSPSMTPGRGPGGYMPVAH